MEGEDQITDGDKEWDIEDVQWDGYSLQVKTLKSPGSIQARRHRRYDNAACQVEGCDADLSVLKEYHQRYKICENHLRVHSIIKDGSKQRFCQQCGRFHALEMFDSNKRSCRDKLRRHNARRRKQQSATPKSPLPSSGHNLFTPPFLMQHHLDDLAADDYDVLDSDQGSPSQQHPALPACSQGAAARSTPSASRLSIPPSPLSESIAEPNDLTANSKPFASLLPKPPPLCTYLPSLPPDLNLDIDEDDPSASFSPHPRNGSGMLKSAGHQDCHPNHDQDDLMPQYPLPSSSTHLSHSHPLCPQPSFPPSHPSISRSRSSEQHHYLPSHLTLSTSLSSPLNDASPPLCTSHNPYAAKQHHLLSTTSNAMLQASPDVTMQDLDTPPDALHSNNCFETYPSHNHHHCHPLSAPLSPHAVEQRALLPSRLQHPPLQLSSHFSAPAVPSSLSPYHDTHPASQHDQDIPPKYDRLPSYRRSTALSYQTSTYRIPPSSQPPVDQQSPHLHPSQYQSQSQPQRQPQSPTQSYQTSSPPRHHILAPCSANLPNFQQSHYRPSTNLNYSAVHPLKTSPSAPIPDPRYLFSDSTPSPRPSPQRPPTSSEAPLLPPHIQLPAYPNSLQIHPLDTTSGAHFYPPSSSHPQHSSLHAARSLLAAGSQPPTYTPHEHLVTLSLKCFKCDPSELPSNLRCELMSIVDEMVGLEGYIRPGCVHLTLDMFRAVDAAPLLAHNIAARLSSCSSFWREGRRLVCCSSSLALLEAGNIRILDTADMSTPEITQMSPICILDTDSALVRVHATGVDSAGVSLYCRTAGQYLQLDIEDGPCTPEGVREQQQHGCDSGAKEEDAGAQCLQLQFSVPKAKANSMLRVELAAAPKRGGASTCKLTRGLTSAPKVLLIVGSREVAKEICQLEAPRLGHLIGSVLPDLGRVLEFGNWLKNHHHHQQEGPQLQHQPQCSHLPSASQVSAPPTHPLPSPPTSPTHKPHLQTPSNSPLPSTTIPSPSPPSEQHLNTAPAAPAIQPTPSPATPVSKHSCTNHQPLGPPTRQPPTSHPQYTRTEVHSIATAARSLLALCSQLGWPHTFNLIAPVAALGCSSTMDLMASAAASIADGVTLIEVAELWGQHDMACFLQKWSEAASSPAEYPAAAALEFDQHYQQQKGTQQQWQQQEQLQQQHRQSVQQSQQLQQPQQGPQPAMASSAAVLRRAKDHTQLCLGDCGEDGHAPPTSTSIITCTTNLSSSTTTSTINSVTNSTNNSSSSTTTSTINSVTNSTNNSTSSRTAGCEDTATPGGITLNTGNHATAAVCNPSPDHSNALGATQLVKVAVALGAWGLAQHVLQLLEVQQAWTQALVMRAGCVELTPVLLPLGPVRDAGVL